MDDWGKKSNQRRNIIMLSFIKNKSIQFLHFESQLHGINYTIGFPEKNQAMSHIVDQFFKQKANLFSYKKRLKHIYLIIIAEISCK